MHKWLRCDLHMHSEFSKPYETEPGKVKHMEAKDFVDTLIGKQIDVFSLTDHNTFNSKYYTEIKDYIKDKKIKVIYGCEFNIYLDKNSGDHFQANIYFSNNDNLQDIEKAVKELYPDINARPFLEEIIQKLNSYRLNYIIFPEANKSGGIEKVWNKITKTGQIERFLKNGMQRIFKAYDSTDKFNETSIRMWALSYFKKTKEFGEYIEKLTDEQEKVFINDIVHYLKKDIEDKIYDADVIKYGDIIINYGKCFTYFRFSDWHNGHDYNPEFKNYIYGNVNMPFESLELAVLDPQSRIQVISENDNLVKPINFIKTVSFVMEGKTYKIDFSEGLNVIVGKRASGKSLLMSILLELNSKNGETLQKYCKNMNIDVDSITCITSDGEEIKRGQLDSLLYIEQSAIAKIFEDPDYADNGIKEYFLKLPEIDYSSFNKIVSNLKKIEKMNYNYKSMTSVIKYSSSMKHFVFKHLNLLDINTIVEESKQIIESLKTIKQSMERTGFRTDDIDNELEHITNFLRKVYMKINLYNSLITATNTKIDEINKNNSAALERTRLARESFDSSFKILTNNFDNLLAYKKVEYLIDNFTMPLPDVTKARKSNYIFVANYQVETDDLKQKLIESITDQISRKKGMNNDLELIKNYVIDPNIQLKTQSKNLYESLEKKFVIENVKIIRSIFEEKNKVDIDKFTSLNQFVSEVKKGNLDDITNSSLGRKSITYLELMLDKTANILMFDQPEDNIDNDYISNHFVPLIKENKKTKQLIFITHNPSVAVYSDAFNYIFAFNDGRISYENHYIESPEDKKTIINILDGGMPSFSNRNLKYGNVIGEFEYGTQVNKK